MINLQSQLLQFSFSRFWILSLPIRNFRLKVNAAAKQIKNQRASARSISEFPFRNLRIKYRSFYSNRHLYVYTCMLLLVSITLELQVEFVPLFIRNVEHETLESISRVSLTAFFLSRGIANE